MSEEPQNNGSRQALNWGLGIALGLGLGTAIGVSSDNVIIGVATGFAACGRGGISFGDS